MTARRKYVILSATTADVITLPAIAEYFEISIDELMGISRENENNAMNKINNEIAGKTGAEKKQGEKSENRKSEKSVCHCEVISHPLHSLFCKKANKKTSHVGLVFVFHFFM